MRRTASIPVRTILLSAVLLSVVVAGGGLADGGTVPENVDTQDGDDVWIDPELSGGNATMQVQDGGTVQAVVRFEDFDHSTFEAQHADEPPERRIAAMQRHAADSQSDLETYAASTDGVTVKRNFWLVNAALVTIDTETADVKELAVIDGVEAIHQNPSFDGPDVDPVDTNETDADLDWSVEQIGADDAWDQYDTKGDDVKLAVIDTGVDPDHPDIDLYSQVEDDPTYPGGWAYFNGGTQVPGSEPFDTGKHGTMSAGTAVGGDDRGAYVGVAPEADLMVTGTIHKKAGAGTLLGSFEWAVAHDADVISMSLSCVGDPRECDLTSEAVRNAEAFETTVVAASGNDGQGTHSPPGSYYDVIGVGASDADGDITEFSSGTLVDSEEAWGDQAPEDWPDEYVTPVVSAPGNRTLTTLPDGEYGSFTGTSSSAPHVAGAVALMQSATDEYHGPDAMREALVETAWKPDDWDESQANHSIGGKDSRYGHGIIDVPAAIEYLETEYEDNPTIETSVTDASEEGGWIFPDETSLTVDWDATAPKGIDDVTVEVIDPDGSTVATYSGQAGSETYTEEGTYGEEYTIEITATGTAGETTCKRLVGPADGENNFEFERCTPVDEGADFKTTDVSVNRSELTIREEVTIEIEVTNVGDEAGTEYVFPTADGALTAFDDGRGELLELEPGESATIERETSPDVSGNLTIGSTAEPAEDVELPELTVLGYEFKTAALDFPDRLDVDNRTTMASYGVKIKNTGDLPARGVAKVTVNGSLIGTKGTFAAPRTLEPGESAWRYKTFTPKFLSSRPGTIEISTDLEPVEEGDATKNVELVKGGYQPVVTEFDLEETTRVNETYEATLTIENTGNATARDGASLYRKGGDKVFKSSNLTSNLAPGESETITLDDYFEQSGEYEIGTQLSSDEDGLTAGPQTLEVVEPKGDADFYVTDLSVSPEQVGPNEWVTIEAEVENKGDGFEAVEFRFTEEGEELGVTDERGELEPGESKTFTFSTRNGEEGEYEVGTTLPLAKGVEAPTYVVANETGESEFETVDVSASDESIAPGDEVEFTATIENVGDAKGTVFVSPRIDGEPPTLVPIEKSLKLEAGERGTVTFNETFDEEGEYELGVNIPTAKGVDLPTVTVEQQGEAAFEMTGVGLSDEQVAPGEEFNVTAEITNVGDAAGTKFLSLTFDGETPGVAPIQKSVDLEPGESDTVTFTSNLQNEGEYLVGTTVDAADGVERPTLTVAETGGVPTVETFELEDRSQRGSWIDEATIDLEWSVGHTGDDSTDVTVSVRNLDRSVDREQFTGASGTETYLDSAAGWDDEYGETFRIRLNAVDSDGDELCTQFVGPADGTTGNFERSDC